MVLSQTPGAVQRNWRLPAEFPLSPQEEESRTLGEYFDRLVKDALFAATRFGSTKVVEFGRSADGSELFVLGEFTDGAVKPWSLVRITFEDENFVHESRGTFFSLEGARKRFTLIQGLPWDGGDSIDDYA